MKISRHIRNGVRYLGISAPFFMGSVWASDRIKYNMVKGTYEFQNGDRVLVAQSNPLPSEICVYKNYFMMGGGKSFAEFDDDFELPMFDGH